MSIRFNFLNLYFDIIPADPAIVSDGYESFHQYIFEIKEYIKAGSFQTCMDTTGSFKERPVYCISARTNLLNIFNDIRNEIFKLIRIRIHIRVYQF